MKEVAPNLYIGTIHEGSRILSHPEEWRLVNVAKTLHLNIHGWSTTGKYSKHPHYIIYEEPTYITVNWVDGDAHLFDYDHNGVNVVKQLLAFIQKNLQDDKKVLITCDQAQSRSPSVALLYLAKVLHTIPDTSYDDARSEFVKIYPGYAPKGITDFLRAKWNEL